MTSAYILIAAILVLGAVIATLGDRIGTKVGKARLSLFNLRPRKTATLVTIITGSLISASTLGILFATSESLREGVFQLDNILKKLRIARGEVDIINAEKFQVENELTQAQTQLKDLSAQGSVLRSEINSLLKERQVLNKQKKQLSQQISQLKSQVVQRDQELAEKNQELSQRNQELEEKNQELSQRNQEIAEQKQIIAQGENRLKEVEQQLNGARDEISQLETRRQTLEQELDGAKSEIAQLETRRQTLEQELDGARGEIAQLETRRQTLEQELDGARGEITQLETRRQELEQELDGARDEIAQLETRRQELEQELGDREKLIDFLAQEARILEQNYQILRQGKVAILRGQVLASGVVRIVEPDAAPQAVDELLRQANKAAIEITQSGNYKPNGRLVQIPQSQAERLIKQIQDGQDYIVRILSVGNYVKGEQQIQVFADAVVNQVVFEAGHVLATIPIDASTMNQEEIRVRLNQLLAASEFRASRAGILGKIQLGDGNSTKILRFIEQLEEYDEPINVRVVAQQATYRAGPLKMQLIAIQNGEILFST
ncbi:MAG: DUF3084 domain-containing protein [Symploca sp. SIO2D2]|nr:DUF3084 domain-containing protein [Symploca sp. SIO2D2]